MLPTKTSFMKFIITGILYTSMMLASNAQNIGIGIPNPTRAKLEVWGAAGTGTTSGLFGGDRGISLHRNYAALGLNYYVDNANVARYMGPGHAALWQYIHNDATLLQGLALYMYPLGADNAVLPAPNRVWNFTSNNRFQILSNGGNGSALLDVGRGTGGDGAAMFLGTEFHSHFNYSTNEHTYIRGGKSFSNVVINDITGGKVIFGNGNATVGVNTNYYIPPTTLEVRQSTGGMELSHSYYPDKAWEWRVMTGGNPTFNLYYSEDLKAQFLPATGALVAVSDERLKTNIEPLEPVMDRIMLLQPVTYMMKNAVQGQRRTMGFIAQHVAPLFPLLVSSSMPGGNNLLGLNYNGFGVLAVKGVQEEQQQMEKISNDFIEIENRLKQIEKKLGVIHQ
jgi:hypothetical protein